MRLVEIGALSTDSDLMLWEASCDTISHQIGLKLARKEGGLMEIFNAVVASLPRSTDVFRISAISSKPSLQKSRQNLIDSLLKLLPVLFDNGWKKNPDVKKHVLIDVFSLIDEPDASRIFKLTQKDRLITEEDIEQYFDVFDKKLERLLSYGKPQFETSSDDVTRGKYANLCVEVLVAVAVSVKNGRKITEFFESQNLKVPKVWMTRIPEMFDKITELYDYPTLFDVAMALDEFPLRKVFMARQFACQSLIEVFCGMAPATKYKVRETVRQELEKASRFVGSAAELGHEEILSEFSPKISVSIEDSKRRLEAETIERLRRSGYLENLGTPPDELVCAQIASIREILPHFSTEFVHLALRHFSYNSELTLGNLLSRENLPIELLRLENAQLRAGVGSGEWPPLDFTASDEIEKSARAEKFAKDEEIRKKNEQRSATNLFSLALSDRSPTPPVDSEAELQTRARLYRTSVLAKLQKIRADASASASDERLAADAENLVPMATSKKYSALNSLKISEADKVAIRPTYDKYRYETPSQDGVYDDEYDDEFDGREFNVERLNQELETSSEEEDSPSQTPATRGGASSRGTRGRGGRGGGGSSDYTGGRERQQKERHKSDFKQRGADRKSRGRGAF